MTCKMKMFIETRPGIHEEVTYTCNEMRRDIEDILSTWRRKNGTNEIGEEKDLFYQENKRQLFDFLNQCKCEKKNE